MLQDEKDSTHHYCLEDEGRGTGAKGWGWTLEGGESKEMDSPLESSKRTQLC